MRFCQLRLNDVMATSPFFKASGPWPKHGPHQDSRILAPTDRNTAAIDSPPSRGSGFSISRLTPPDPGKMTNSFGAFSKPCSRPDRITSAASSKSSYPPLVHDPMKALSKVSFSSATSSAGNAFPGAKGLAMKGTSSDRSSVSSMSQVTSAPGLNDG